VLGALQGSEFTAIGNTWIYEPKTDAWSSGTPMPEDTQRGAAAVGVVGTRVYVAGGSRNQTVADFSSYDTATDAWEPLPDLPQARNHLVGGVVDGVFFAIGGRQLGIDDLYDRVDAYAPIEGAWQTRASMPTARGGCAAGVVGNRIIVVGGEGNPATSTGVFAETEAYQAEMDMWQVFDPMPTPRHGTGAAGLDGVLYVPAGATQQGFGAVDTNEAFVL
jgi:Kelch motif protein